MKNQNIQIGIDLGTTNSEIAVNNKGNIEIIKNVFNDEYTPSVFGIGKAKNKIIGKVAYEKLYKDPSDEEFKNNKGEIKRLMGTPETVNFPRLGKDLSPEEISAEILISLKEDLSRKYKDMSTMATVITVPAYFSVLQKEATKRAGNIAGFKHVVLLQEPIAAAIAYGFMNSKSENWLVYDLGGGTFDVALISSNYGSLSVLGHKGDNFLGGKNFDLEIVDKIIVPQILKKYKITDFNRGNKKFGTVFAKLKGLAEKAKIYLTQEEETTIEVEKITDDAGEEIYINIPFSRKEYEYILKPFIDKTIDLSRETIKEAGVKATSVSRIILVGAPTVTPYIKERLETVLKIKVDTSSDPLTVVARGACIFGISQKIPNELLEVETTKNSDTKILRINFESLTSETEETITGIFEELKDSDKEFYLQIQSEGGFFSGTKQRVKNGRFSETVTLEKNKTNLFWIYLFDKKGNPISINPDSFSITHGVSFSSGAPIPHSVGVGVAMRAYTGGKTTSLIEKMDIFFEKDSILPLKATKPYKTIRKLVKGDKDNALPIKIYEGESSTPDQNEFICDLKITGENIPYDLPEGTEVEVTIDMDESSGVKIEAFIPTIDLNFSGVRSTDHAQVLSIEAMQTQIKTQSERVTKLEKTCSAEEKTKLSNLVNSVNTSLEAGKADEEEKRKADKELRELKNKLDELERVKEFPQLKIEFNELTTSMVELMNEYGDQKQRGIHNDQLNILKTEGYKAIENEDKVLLSRTNEQLNDLKQKIIFSNPATWLYQFNRLIKEDHKWISEKEAQYFLQKGQRAIEVSDMDEVQRCVRSLWLLLPVNEQSKIQNSMSGITN
jgi:molecular chaperone DnaK